MKLKLFTNWPSLRNWVGKTFLVMRLMLFIIAVSVSQLFAVESYSQSARVNLNIADQSVKEVLGEIQNQSEFFFMFNSKIVDVERKVDLHVKDEKITKVLDELFAGTDIAYTVVDRQIVLFSTKTLAEQQQMKKISGKVTDQFGASLPGVSVIVKGTTIGVISDNSGNYSLSNISENATLVFSFVGMKAQEVSVGNKMTINLVMAEEAFGLEEVVAIGYGTRKKETLTGAISNVEGKDLKINPAPNLSSSLGGKIPGLISVNYSGQPGEDGNKLLIRGLGTLGDNSPLVIVDGIDVGNIDRLDPNDIESLSVLKDASAAIYGSKAANGVIIVTTKKGTTGKPVIEYGYNMGLGQPTMKPHMANAYDYNNYINAYYVANNESDKQMSVADLDKLRTGSSPDTYFANTDWWKAVVRQYTPIQRHTASIRGGTDELKYFASVGYLDQQSVFKQGADGFNQSNYRVNIDWQVTQFIKVGMKVSGRFEDKEKQTTPIRDIWQSIMAINPRYPVNFSNGLPWEGWQDGWNPSVMVTDAGGADRFKTNSFTNMITYEVKIPGLEGLSVDGFFDQDNSQTNERYQQFPWTVYSSDGKGNYTPTIAKRLAQIYISQSNNTSTSNTFNAKLNYAHKFGKHNINAFVAYEQSTYDYNWISAYRKDIISTSVDAQLFMGSQIGQVANGSAYKNSRRNYFSRLSYDFSNKYFLDFTLRRDGSPIFPKNKRYGNFPGIAASWRISEENFMKNKYPFISNLKLRTSWGQLGNDRVAEYQYLTAYNYQDAQVLFGGANNSLPGFYPSVNANPNITWEVAENLNLGLEAGLFEKLIEVNFDVYRNSRKNILIQRNASIPAYVGLSLPNENLGKMRNSGFELQLTHNKTIGKVSYSISGNYSYNNNKVIDIDETPNVLDWQKQTGKPFGAQLYYKTAGLYSQADIDNANLPKYGGAKAGDIKVLDYNKDGKIDGDDRVRMDKSLDVPRIMYGFNIKAAYNSFDLNLAFQGAEKVYRYLYTGDIGTRGNFFSDYYTNYWSASNPNGRWPKANPNTFGSTNNNDFFVLPAGYLRLSSMELGYTLPKTITTKVGIEKLRVYFSGSNLFLIYNKLKYFDPEMADTRGYYYPSQRIFNFGVNVSF